VGIERLEVEEEIDERFFSAVWPLTLGHRVEKRRYEVADGEFVWEVDEFLDRSGLWLAEVELNAVEQVAPLPGWLAEFVEREVTEEVRYTNYALSQ
jgi:CYTH domain-containing protein